MVATINIAYAASVSIGVTNLHSLAYSSTFTSGWESGVIDNTSNKYVDVLLAGNFTSNASVAPTANTSILVYVYAVQDDAPTYPDGMDGTESTDSVTSANVGAGFLKLAAVLPLDASTSRVFYFGPVSVAQLFGGIMPNKWGVFVTHNAGATSSLAGSGNKIAYTGVTYTIT